MKSGDYQCKCKFNNENCIISVNNLPHPLGGTFPDYSCNLSINGYCLEETCVCNIGGKEKYFDFE